MQIKMDDLAKFGLDRFGVEIKANKTEGGVLAYGVSTFPIKDDKTCDDMQARIESLIEPGTALARAFMTSDGSLAMNGFKSSARGQVHTMVREGRDAFFRSLKVMEDEHNLTVVADRTITKMVYDELELDKAVIEFGCADHFAVSCAIVKGTHYLGDDKQQHIVLPGPICSITNGDFQSWYNGLVKTRHAELVNERLDEVMSKEKDIIRKALANIERLERRQYDRRHKHNA